jgi:histidinol-phosphatase (PHP family)
VIDIGKDYHVHAMVMKDYERSKLYIERAIELGFKEICITDHMPLSISSASDRIPAGGVSEYCKRVRELAEEFANQIVVKCGIEIDFLPRFESEVEAVLSEGTFDYVIGSSHLHLLESYFQGNYSKEAYAKAMFENTMAAAETGYFDTIAHIDMYKWVFSKAERYPLSGEFEEQKIKDVIDVTLQTIKRCGVNLEINTHLLVNTGKDIDLYPSPYILQRALECGNTFVLGSDAHKPEDVGALFKEVCERV